MYRFQKFARKHKPALATAAAIALCLLLGTTVSAWQAVRATTAEAQAAANEQEANANAKQAKEQAIEATAQRDEAQKQRDEVKALADKLAEKERQLQRSLYASNMNLAKSAWDAGNIRRVNRLLDQHRPQAGETDLRGFEWHYLYRMCHSELLTLQGHSLNSPAPHSVAFSPDGKRLANPAYGFTGTRAILVRDAQTGEAVLSIKGGRGYGVAFSPDGKRLAFGDYLSWDEAKKVYVDLEVKVCDAQTGQQLLSCKGHTSIVRCVAFSPDGKHLASSSSVRDDTQNTNVAGEVKIWDAQTGEELRSIKGHSYTVDSVAFSPDGLRLATASNDRTVKIWNAHTGQELLSLQDGGESVAFSGDGKRLASGGKVWDAETGKELLSVEGRPESVAFSPDGKRLVYSGGGVTVRDAQTGAELLSFKGHTTSVTSVVFSPDGTRVASGSRDNTVKVWDATTSQQRRSFGGATRVQSVTFSPDGKRVAFGVGGFFSKGPGEVKVSDSQTGQELNSLKGHTSIIRSVAYSPDGKRLASASSDKTVKLWNAETGQELLTFKGHTGEVVSVAFSPDSTRVASSISYPNEMSTPGRPGETGEVKVWDAANGQELLSLKGHSRFVNRVVFSPDGKRLATLSRDQTLRVWDAQSGHEIHTLKVRVSFAGDLAFSPDGKLLASSDVQPDPRGLGGVKVWDSLSGQELLAFDGHSTPVQSIAFSPDGKRFITGAGSPGAGRGEIKMWDALTGQELLNLDGSSGPSDDVAFSPEGYRLAGRGHDGTLTIWDATPLPEKP